MFGSIFRVLLGFILACLAAGFTKVLFALTPSEVFSGEADRLSSVMYLATQTATHSALFAAPFALIAAAIGEWQGLRNWAYYAVAAIAIALAGFLAQYQSENLTQPTIVNNYALTAFLTSGFVGGLVYWLFSGRDAGGQATPSHMMVGRTGGSATRPRQS
jgi:heme/copper-type cytochrome/quinol oxidase subunit 3